MNAFNYLCSRGQLRGSKPPLRKPAERYAPFQNDSNLRQLFHILTVVFVATSLTVRGQTARDDEEENKDGITISGAGDVTNESRFFLFKDNLNKGIKDKFEIWQYTIDGGPIIIKVKSNGKTVTIKTNKRKDRFSGKPKTSKAKVPAETVKQFTTFRQLMQEAKKQVKQKSRRFG